MGLMLPDKNLLTLSLKLYSLYDSVSNLELNSYVALLNLRRHFVKLLIGSIMRIGVKDWGGG